VRRITEPDQPDLDQLAARLADPQLREVIRGLVTDDAMAQILIARLDEVETCWRAGAYHLAVIGTGSLYDVLRIRDPAVRTARNPTLNMRLDRAHTRGWIQHDAFSFSGLVREYRNLVHPREQLKKRFTPDDDTVLLCWQPVLRRCQRPHHPVSEPALPDLIRFALGSGLGTGELCAVRWMDLNLEGIPVVSADDVRLVPVVAVRQNVVPVKGKGLSVHDGKSAMALRVVPLPQLVTTVLRARQHGDEDPEWPVFAAAGRDGRPTYRWLGNLRRSVRRAREQVGLEWMTPYTWRRTYATILDDEISLSDRAKADLMGHAKFLKNTYVSRGELHPDAAVVLDAAMR
jgi:integrase